MKRVLSFLMIPLLAAPGCLTFTPFQSARIVPGEASTMSIAVASNDYRPYDDDGDDQDEAGWTYAEMHKRVGRGDGKDVSIMIGAARRRDGWTGLLAGGDARVSLWRGHLTSEFGAQATALGLHMFPGLVATVPLGSRLELNASTRFNEFLFYGGGFWGFTAWTGGVGVGLRLSEAVWLRPELGWLRETDTGHDFRQVGLGIEWAQRPR